MILAVALVLALAASCCTVFALTGRPRVGLVSALLGGLACVAAALAVLALV